MNPVDRFRIDNFKEILKEIECLGNHDYLRQLEDRIIQEIVKLVSEETDAARAKLQSLEEMINELKITPRTQLLISALKNSISGALSAARFCLL